MDGQLDKKTKHARAVAMAEVCGQCKKEYLQGQVGRTVKVLFERESSELWHNGHSPEYITVKVPRVSIDKTLRRKILSVYITSADSECCYGELSE
jgi:threonylcarbamoyladenosine tRNA methylthiotransferase MtaB